MTRIVLCLSHSIEEHDQLRLLTGLGYEVFSIGGYIDPAHPHDDKRPALDIPFYPELKAAVDALGTPDNLGAAQSHIPDAILDWLGDDGVIMFHHLLPRLFGDWQRLRDWKVGAPGRRLVWRSVGQTDVALERTMVYYRARGLERVAYSPREQHIPDYSGHDAIIRFYADPDEWTGWVGLDPTVINITQGLMQRGGATSPWFWTEATQGLRAQALGEGSEVGILPYAEMKRRLCLARAYLYTGTRPASYTLGLIEAAMTGIPIVSIGPNAWGQGIDWLPPVFEGHEVAVHWSNYPDTARLWLLRLLESYETAVEASHVQRATALRLFSREVVGKAWKEFLG
jgi:hypothetical protein